MNKLLLGMLLGTVLTLLLVALTAYLVITSGFIPARQDEASSGLEAWAAHKSLSATIAREAKSQSPIPADEENLMAGAKVYAGNCSGCHGSPLVPSPDFAKGYSPDPTLFANGDMVTDDPEGNIYWKIDHGIRFTGMPSFNKMLNEKELWQVTLFLKHMDKLPAPVDEYWKHMK